eukprot:TRINITY_DN21626_c1_g1_i1.p1 TRINITY_DN21626_c1_g1~~TRINITY_DN21626_c1_g1_i1.p1  ORF type:complete len:285 (-),score=47.90 TRINITY_DN21626_c1_g1_i1:124-894(-)
MAKKANDGENSPFWAIFAAATTSFAAFSFVLKEIVFNGYQKFRSGFVETPNVLRIQLPQTVQEETLHRPLNGSHSQLAASQQQQGDNSSGSSGSSSPPATSSESDLHPALSVFLVGTIINFVGLLVSVPMALLNHVATSSGPPVPALRDGLMALWQREHALAAYFVYIAVNTTFNVCLILTTSYGSALLSFLSLKLAVPLTAILSPLPWPIIGSNPVEASQWLVLMVMIGGIATFRSGNLRREKLEINSCCWPWCG